MKDVIEKLNVIDAYKTDHYPDNGNVSEEILVLEDGQAVVLHPLYDDQIFDTLEEAMIYAGERRFTDPTL